MSRDSCTTASLNVCKFAPDLYLETPRHLTLFLTEPRSNDDDDESSNVTSSDPDHVTMSFMMGKTPVKLELDKNDNIPRLSYYYTAETGGKLVQWTMDEGQVNYTAHLIDRSRCFGLHCGRLTDR